MRLLGIEKWAGTPCRVARIFRITAPLGVSAVLFHYGMFWGWIGINRAIHIALWSASACLIGTVAAFAIPHWLRQGMSPSLKRFVGAGFALAGFALIVASPFIVLSETLMWHLRGLRGVYYLESYPGGTNFMGVSYVRWMLLFWGVAYSLVMVGVYLIQHAKSSKKHDSFTGHR